ncbi:aminotransferase-like domain-containing protein [Salinicola avicenniae]|uniref:aminotransferase-like domain-containing protein n=1 Tax=Salinicola avicenniae TaxID=2916836 RepID=UPI00207310AF|nr:MULTISPECIES: PLP-dependent aminotransferase family protein [unclassified Salinicola]
MTEQSTPALLAQIERRYRAQADPLSKRCRLEQALRELIETSWHNGQRLPGHRALCRHLGVARNTLAGAIDTLQQQGYLLTDHGRGTWVRKALVSSVPSTSAPALSARADAVLAEVGASHIQSGAFVPGVPDIMHFPIAKWRHLYSRITAPHNTLMLSYSSGGYGPLKRAIADFLERWRGIRCELDQIIITEGAHHGMQLCTLALADHGDRVVMDSPFYWGARNVFMGSGLTLDHAIWQPATGYVSPLPPAQPRLLYFTGSHHYPMGYHTVSAHKRDLAERLSPTWILEDDYEFGNGHAPDLLFTPDTSNHVLIGSFSKLMFPGLRLGYLVVPRGISAAVNRLRSEIFREGRLLDQAVLATFIAEGDLDTWCRRMSRAYLERQQRLHRLLSGLPGVCALSPPSGNISLSLQLDADLDDERLSQYLLTHHHLVARPLSRVCAAGDPRRGLILGIGMIEGETLERQGRLLARGIREFVQRQRRRGGAL